MTLQAAATLGGLTLLSPLGSGGQATVFRARRADGREVALKVIEPRADGDGERARREAHALSRIQHASLPRCDRLIEDPGGRWLALELELIEGVRLDEIARDLDPAARRMALRHVAAALAHLHAHGVVHRDVKPSNVVVAHDFAASSADAARCKLVDLGIAVATGNPAPLTQLGHPGTVAYMAPEALAPTSFRVPPGKPTLDVFSFGVTAWVVLRGVHPTGLPLDGVTGDFPGAYEDHAGAEHLFLPPEDLDDPFERVVARCLRLRADERPHDGAALVALLDEAMAPATLPASKPARSTTLKAHRPAAGPSASAASAAPASSHAARPDGTPELRAPVRPPETTPMGAVRIPPAPTLLDAPRKRRAPWTTLAVVAAALAGLGALWMVRDGALSRLSDLSSTSSVSAPASASSSASERPVATSVIVPSLAITQTAPATLDWSSVRESNVRHSSAHGCETKVLAGWFRIRCATRPGETLHVTAPVDTGATISTDATSTTLFVPLTGVDRTFTFDWAGGRGARTLSVVGHAVEHRYVQSQGELSAP